MTAEPITGTRKSAALAMTGLLATGTSRMVVSVLIGRVGGPALLGLTQAALSSAQLASLLGSTSTGSAAAKHIAAAHGRGDVRRAADLIGAFRLRGGAWCLMVCLVAGLVAVRAEGRTAHAAIAVAALSAGFGFYAVDKGVLLGAGHVRLSARLELMVSLLGAGGVLVLLASGVRDVLVITPVAVAYLAYALLARSTTRSERRRATPVPLGGEIRRFILLGVVGTLASAGLAQAAVLVAAKTGGAALAGQYGAALTLTAPVSLLATSVGLALFPAMSRSAVTDPRQLRRYVVAGTRVMSLLCVLIIAPVILLSAPLAELLWGPQFEDVAQIAPLLLLGAGITMTSVPAVTALTSGSTRHVALSAAGSVVGAGSGILTWLALVPRDPLLGVPTGYLVGSAITALLPTLLAMRILGAEVRWLARWGAVLGWMGVTTVIALDVNAGAVPARVGLSVLCVTAWCLVDFKTLKMLLPGANRG